MIGAILAALLGYSLAGIYILIVHRWLEREATLVAADAKTEVPARQEVKDIHRVEAKFA